MRAGIVGLLAAFIVLVGLAASSGSVSAKTPDKPLPRVVVYVESQNLCFDSVVTAQNLPANGPFQELVPDPDDNCGVGDGALKTAFGPGDPGYVGGRWVTQDGAHFLCPLLGPGYSPVN